MSCLSQTVFTSSLALVKTWLFYVIRILLYFLFTFILSNYIILNVYSLNAKDFKLNICYVYVGYH